jgi:molybdopterin molybdotransferase
LDLNDELLDVKEAQKRILDFFIPNDTQLVNVRKATGYFLSEDLQATFDYPLFVNSAMDGFAVRSVDVTSASTEKPVNLSVVADIPAGESVAAHIGCGESARIMTGAPVPGGADAVVPIEDTDVNYRESGLVAPKEVKIYTSVAAGENIRPVGDDVRKGDLVMRSGKCLEPQDIGFLSMLGFTNVPTYRKPRVGILSSGDELVEPDFELTPGKIYDANRPMLLSLADSFGCEALDLGIAKDNENDVRSCLDNAVKMNVDMILSTAGVSVGAFDVVRQVIDTHGKMDFWRVNMRPGKPIAFGNYSGVPFIGLPGNPVAAFIGFHVFVRPIIEKMNGGEPQVRNTYRVKLLESIRSDGRESYLRVVIITNPSGQLTAQLTGHQGSGNLRSLVDAQALLIVPSGVKSMPAGSYAEAWSVDGRPIDAHRI